MYQSVRAITINISIQIQGSKKVFLQVVPTKKTKEVWFIIDALQTETRKLCCMIFK